GASASRVADLAFTVDLAATTTCALDGAAPTPCVSPVHFADLPDGAHTFRVDATAEGKTGYAAVGWTVDTAAPSVTLAGSPARARTRTAAFTFRASEEAAPRCSFDGAPPSPCASPRSWSGLADGPHHLVVDATDAAGNVGQATLDWTLDTVAPAVT